MRRAPHGLATVFVASFAYAIAPTILVLGAVALLGFFPWRSRQKRWLPAR